MIWWLAAAGLDVKANVPRPCKGSTALRGCASAILGTRMALTIVVGLMTGTVCMGSFVHVTVVGPGRRHATRIVPVRALRLVFAARSCALGPTMVLLVVWLTRCWEWRRGANRRMKNTCWTASCVIANAWAIKSRPSANIGWALAAMGQGASLCMRSRTHLF